ncbi:helix-turn-helix domain-containing protein [Roseobacter sp. HKCCD9010]|uniref:helix-turn-helix domain-containing protein n=1 Tax=unclassified Roseobacter TaxID=196798 RepID=UPI001492F17E|nr:MULTISPECIES: helix-turn-helix domain-containing protein [unclassified Roseobacter]MBF9049902.1 helix-turn-helix domain-containing protein [Rhodobacterales bacterium HKCCD4356]NNV13559.1 helix-turn-helix domain-containing protein [Roseobacter sp. HKCCD7357]NNV16393.1 helix-turn-helix domain-containing protein [Roseobacter sp. HKCCD8768]NNV25852.1 helix-turn-helix domain-containing protein [Roseobacter sp. HKCCD8192]NNV30110.1 helix-turn-helix domain-containing protein [Roseobacter sp. HKCCD
MNKSFKPYLPGVLAMIAEEISEQVAVRLAEARGGRAVYVPKTPKPGSELSQIVGLEAAKQLSKLLGHGTLKVPCGNIGGAGGRRARIETLWHQGLSHAQIAAEVDVHTRTVERVVASLRDDSEPKLPF